jgi:NAD(P)-dependent dehydrogenase (short-subunit alcohol dehydrogenase family)
LTTRACVITGASSGIGEACAVRLADAGWRVFAGVRREEDAARLRATIAQGLTPLRIDVTDPASIAAAADEVSRTVDGGALDGLVNNAGIAIAAPLEDIPIDEFRHQLEVNVIGQLAVTQAFLPSLRKGSGRIVLMGSIAGRWATPFLGPYSASKFALEAMADALRVELQPWDVHVAIVEPGSIVTPIWSKGAEHATRLAARFRPGVDERYGEAMTALRRVAGSAAARGIPPDAVARVVEHALNAATPRTRYLVGADAKLRARLLRFIPDRLRDTLVTRAMGLPVRGARTGTK